MSFPSDRAIIKIIALAKTHNIKPELIWFQNNQNVSVSGLAATNKIP
jgi:hypothetical protein